jgi:lipid-A-disaccharide synthase
VPVYNTWVRILISAGEASGEMYGAQLMKALRTDSIHVGTGVPARPAEGSSATAKPPLNPDRIEFFGVGGDKMRAAGCDIVVDSKNLAVVGITEILSHLPKIWGLFHKLIAEADRRKPDVAIVIDSPAFNWRVARQMHKRGIPVVYYVCPQFWAWRQGRVRLLRKYVDKALVIFPFEEQFYRDRGVDAEFVGHPLAELSKPSITRDQYAAENGLAASKPWITLMPGSRVKEVRMNLPGMIESARLLGPEYEFLLPVAPTLDENHIEHLVNLSLATDESEVNSIGKGTAFSRAENLRVPTDGTTESRALPASAPGQNSCGIHLVPDALPALAHSRAGIIASGTATVEAALMDLPFVMVYRVTPLTYLLGRSTVKVRYFAMVNLIAGEQVVPELVQADFTPEKVTAEIRKIIPESEARKKMLEGLKDVRLRLEGDQESHIRAADRAARAIFALWQTRNAQKTL